MQREHITISHPIWFVRLLEDGKDTPAMCIVYDGHPKIEKCEVEENILTRPTRGKLHAVLLVLPGIAQFFLLAMSGSP